MYAMVKKIHRRAETLNDKLAHVQFLTGNMVKLVAICSMCFDHFCKIILEWFKLSYWPALVDAGQISHDQYNDIIFFIQTKLYPVGSIAFPLFCFLLVEGFLHTRSRKRYMGLMGLFALLSELPFDIGFFSVLSLRDGTFPFYWKYQNVFFTLFLGLAALTCIEHFACQSGKTAPKRTCFALQLLSLTVFALLAELIRCDYGATGILFIAVFYVCRKNRLYQVLLFLAASIFAANIQPSLYLFLTCLVILLYNGRRGKRKWKYTPYVFYPAHIFIFYLVTLVLQRVIAA